MPLSRLLAQKPPFAQESFQKSVLPLSTSEEKSPSSDTHWTSLSAPISRTGENLHPSKQGGGSVAQCDRKVCRGSSCCLWLSRWIRKRESLVERKQRRLESQLASLDQIPSSASGTLLALFLTQACGVWSACSCKHFSLCSWKNWTRKLNSP